MKRLILTLLLGAGALAIGHAQQYLVPTQGMTITQSVTLKQDTFWLSAPDSLHPALRIEGDGITVDFNGAVIDGGAGKALPDQFVGRGIVLKGRNITLKNATLKGFKLAIYAEGVDSLRLLDCDLSYNWRPRLRSGREREDFSDWLSFHQNDHDEWLRYGAGIYLKNCPHALVRGCTVTQGMNGLLLTGCNDGLFYNNRFHFNSGLGIGLYHSSRNRVMHNRLDFNVRGYSHGFYQRGQDSAAILVYEQSNENTFAYNSATHSGDGFFLWAGQTTMDTGEGGCNDNLLYQNDFSYAPTNGVEVTFSRNKIVGNTIRECTYGIWGGYSFQSIVHGNFLADCRTGIAIEHGQENQLLQNYFEGDSVGIQLWARSSQPADWGYAKHRDTRSRDYQIGNNMFRKVRNPLKISASQTIAINDFNLFQDFEKLLVVEKPNENLVMVKNEIAGYKGWHDAETFKRMNPIVKQINNNLIGWAIDAYHVVPLPDGESPLFSADERPTGRQLIMINDWGPYNFSYPTVYLQKINGIDYFFSFFGEGSGRWALVNHRGFASPTDQKAGGFPDWLSMEKLPGATDLFLEFEYTGPAFTDQFGHYHPANLPYRFTFRRFEQKLDWQVRWYNYDEANDPLTDYPAFKNLKAQPPLATKTVDDLYFAWWDKPAEGVAPDRFATFAEASFDIEPGEYLLELTSDDGARLFLDGKRLIDHWNIHEPATDEVRVRLGGHHRLEVEHFDGGGFGTLGMRWRRVGE